MYLSETLVIFLLLKISAVSLRDNVFRQDQAKSARSNQEIRNAKNGKSMKKHWGKIENLGKQLEETSDEYYEKTKLPSHVYCYDKNAVSNVFDPSSSSESSSSDSSSSSTSSSSSNSRSSPRKEFNYQHFKCLLSHTADEEEVEYFMANITGAFHSHSPSVALDSLLGEMTPVFRNTNTDFFVVDGNFLLGIWHPFEDDIRGFAVRNSSGKFVFIPMYQALKGNDLDDIVIGGFIPETFLRELTYKSTVKEKRELYVVMIALIGVENVHNFFGASIGVENALGVSFPGYCKRNYLPMVQVISRTGANVSSWRELGQEYHDTEDWFGCLLERVSYFAPSKSYYFESVKENYCLQRPIDAAINFQQTPIYEDVFPEKFCMNVDLEIPIYKCMACNVLYDLYYRDANCFSHVTSNKTELLYRGVIGCYVDSQCSGNMNFVGDPSLSYVDIKLIFLIARRLITTVSELDVNVNSLSDMLDEGLKALREQSKNHSMVYVSNFLNQFLFCLRALRSGYANEMFTRSTFIYQNFNAQNQNVIGLAVYKNNHTKFKDYNTKTLTMENATTSSGDVRVYLNEDGLTRNGIVVNLFVIDDGNFKGNASNNYKTKIVAIQHNLPRPVRFRIAWKDFAEIAIPVNNTNLILAYIAEHYSYSTCRTVEQLIFFEVSTVSDSKYISGRYERIEISNLLSFLPLDLDMAYFADDIKDILSQISITVNPKAGTVFYKHWNSLRMIKYVCTSLSCLGIVLIVSSAIFFKHWYKKRFYTIQLTIAIAFQTGFYLLKSDKINRVGYLFFLYSLLAQFFWIMLIGYRQYKRFIKIFHFSDVSNTKSLIIGWLGPGVITILSLFQLQWITKCTKCSCSKTYKSFPYAIFVPIYLIIICNVVNYIAIMVNIWRSAVKSHGANNKNKRKAAIMLLFLLGIPWTSVFALRTSWSWLILLGWYLFYIVAPLQGFTLFIFVVVFDENTRNSWIYLFRRR